MSSNFSGYISTLGRGERGAGVSIDIDKRFLIHTQYFFLEGGVRFGAQLLTYTFHAIHNGCVWCVLESSVLGEESTANSSLERANLAGNCARLVRKVRLA